MKAKFPREYGQRANELAKQGIQASGKHATGTYNQIDPDSYIFWGLGCDGCGIWPIRETAWYDTEVKDKAGFHLCDPCYKFGYSKRTISGKFNQQRMPKNKMEIVFRNE